MHLTRRRLLALALGLPAATAFGSVAAAHERVVSRVATRVRPPASGTSATRCASCGGREHTMLRGECPERRSVTARVLRRGPGAKGA
jgi:hypothetical protein